MVDRLNSLGALVSNAHVVARLVDAMPRYARAGHRSRVDDEDSRAFYLLRAMGYRGCF